MFGYEGDFSVLGCPRWSINPDNLILVSQASATTGIRVN